MTIGTLTALSYRPGMPSLPTLRKLIAQHPDFPIIARGKGGRGYEIDLDAAERFVLDLAAGRCRDVVRRREAIRILGLEMIGRAEGHLDGE